MAACLQAAAAALAIFGAPACSTIIFLLTRYHCCAAARLGLGISRVLPAAGLHFLGLVRACCLLLTAQGAGNAQREQTGNRLGNRELHCLGARARARRAAGRVRARARAISYELGGRLISVGLPARAHWGLRAREVELSFILHSFSHSFSRLLSGAALGNLLLRDERAPTPCTVVGCRGRRRRMREEYRSRRVRARARAGRRGPGRAGRPFILSAERARVRGERRGVRAELAISGCRSSLGNTLYYTTISLGEWAILFEEVGARGARTRARKGLLYGLSSLPCRRARGARAGSRADCLPASLAHHFLPYLPATTTTTTVGGYPPGKSIRHLQAGVPFSTATIFYKASSTMRYHFYWLLLLPTLFLLLPTLEGC